MNGINAALALFVFGLGMLLPQPARAETVVGPQLLEQVAAEWPAEWKPEHDENVPVRLTVDRDGAVSRVEVGAGAPESLAAAAVHAAEQWRFAPATRDGIAVAVRIDAVVRLVSPLLGRSEADAAQSPQVSEASKPVPVARAKLPQAAADAAPLALQQVTVLGRALAESRGASDLNIAVGELRAVPRKNATELLKLAPGVFIANEGGEGHAERLYLRGFDAREGQDLELSVDGVPINESGNLHGNGLADLHFIIPELVLGFRVLEGPFDPHQGNYAVAGSANFELGLNQRGLTAKYSRGSFGTQRLLLTWGPQGESERTFGGAELYSTNGFSRNGDARRGAVMAQYQGQLGDHGTWRLAAALYAAEYHSAGVLREADVLSGKQDFFGTYDTGQGGGGTRFQVSGDLETRWGNSRLYQQIFAVKRGMRLRENFTGFLLDTQEAEQQPHGQRGDRFDLKMDEGSFGARGALQSQFTLLGRQQRLELGYFARLDEVAALRQRTDTAGVPYLTDTDLKSELFDLGLFVDGTLKINGWAALLGGVRAELVTFDVLDECAARSVSRPDPKNPPGDDSCLDQQRFGRHREPNQRSSTASAVWLPRGSLALGPFAGATISLSYGRGIRSIDPKYISQDVATPFAVIEAAEGGVSYVRSVSGLSLQARSVFFLTHVNRDLVFSETEGRSVIGGGTRRVGWSGLVRATQEQFDQSINLTLVRSRFDDTGLLVPYAPSLVLRSDTAWKGKLPWSIAQRAVPLGAGLGVSVVGPRALPYGQSSQTLALVDAGLSVGYSAFELGLGLQNLFDSRYRAAEYNFVSDFHSGSQPTLVPARHFVAGAPRTLSLSLSVNLGGEL